VSDPFGSGCLHHGKSRQMGLGSLHTISLAEARDEALLCRKQLRDGIDPIEAPKLRLGKAQVNTARVRDTLSARYDLLVANSC